MTISPASPLGAGSLTEYGIETFPDAPGPGITETFDRRLATGSTSNQTTGVVLATAIDLPGGETISGATFYTAGGAVTARTHGWYALCDTNMNILAVTADQAAGSAWSVANTPYPLNFTAAIWTSHALPGYLCVSCTATITPNFVGIYNSGGPTDAFASIPPVLSGTAGTKTTPPAIGSTLAAVTGVAYSSAYAIVY
jgi:hypothetical protein